MYFALPPPPKIKVTAMNLQTEVDERVLCLS